MTSAIHCRKRHAPSPPGSPRTPASSCSHSIRVGNFGSGSFQFKDMLSLEALGETDAAHKTGAVQLIYWTAIQTAHHEGQRVVSFGQTEKDNEGLARHKRGWGCLEETLTDYRYLPDSAKGSLSEIHSAGKRRLRPVFRKLPVWAGSMLSKFLYHHLG